MTKRLTGKQKLLLQFFAEFVTVNGYSPSVREMAEYFGITIKGAYDHLLALIKKGMILRPEGARARGWHLAPLAGHHVEVGKLLQPDSVYYYDQMKNYPYGDYDSMVPPFHESVKSCVAVRITKDTMSPDIKIGDVAWCKRTPARTLVDTGGIYLVDVRGTDIRMLFPRDGVIHARAKNPLHGTLVIGAREIDAVVAKVVAITRNFEE